MNLHHDLAYSEIAGHLLIHLAGAHQQHHLQLAGRERFKPLPRLRNVALDRPPVSIAFDGTQNSIKYVLIGLERKSAAPRFMARTDVGMPPYPGCIVIDIRLPDMNGLDFQVRPAEVGIRLPVIIITDPGEDERRRKCATLQNILITVP